MKLKKFITLLALVSSILYAGSSRWAPILMGDTTMFVPYGQTAFPTVTTNKNIYISKETVIVSVTNMPGNEHDWVAIYHAGAKNTFANIVSYKYTNGVKNGIFNLGKVKEAGQYEARFFKANTWVPIDTHTFTVKSLDTPTITINQNTYTSLDDVIVSVTNMPGNKHDWVAIYHVGAKNTFANIVSYQYTNGVIDGDFNLGKVKDAGQYEIRVFNANSWTPRAVLGFTIVNNQTNNTTIGVRDVPSTPLSKGTLFASPNGNGDCLSKESPCSIRTAFSKLKAGSVLFLREGKYTITDELRIDASGTQANPTIVESYPGEVAIIQGKFTSGEYAKNHNDPRRVGIKILSNYIKIRKLRVRYMGHEGIVIRHGSYNTIEGCELDHNLLPGVAVFGGDWHNGKYKDPYPDGKYNIIQDNIVHDNSDAELPAQGDHADGIAIASGTHNQILHNNIYHNSDDGIDTWRSNDTYVAYNISHDNGLGDKGNGNGIKAGGNNDTNEKNGRRTTVEHNIAYNNRSRGFNWNAGKEVVFKYNTSYNNGSVGFRSGEDTIVEHNIAFANKTIHHTGQDGSNNSWQIDETVSIISTNKNSKDFLRPLEGSDFENIGAYAHTDTKNNAKIFVIGDSTVHNQERTDDKGNYLEMGWANKLALGSYMKDSTKLYNEARSGASSKSYKVAKNNQHDWEKTKSLIREKGLNNGSYLLIQFGHNDEATKKPYGTTPNKFYNHLKEYVDWAKENGLTPILITPVERRNKNKNKTHGVYPQKVKDLALSEEITMLDLQDKSWNEYNKYDDTVAINKDFAYKKDENTHFSPKGAKIVAGWVKELICESEDEQLCQQFK